MARIWPTLQTPAYYYLEGRYCVRIHARNESSTGAGTCTLRVAPFRMNNTISPLMVGNLGDSVLAMELRGVILKIGPPSHFEPIAHKAKTEIYATNICFRCAEMVSNFN